MSGHGAHGQPHRDVGLKSNTALRSALWRLSDILAQKWRCVWAPTDGSQHDPQLLRGKAFDLITIITERFSKTCVERLWGLSSNWALRLPGNNFNELKIGRHSWAMRCPSRKHVNRKRALTRTTSANGALPLVWDSDAFPVGRNPWSVSGVGAACATARSVPSEDAASF